jgi:hypothetical protein
MDSSARARASVFRRQVERRSRRGTLMRGDGRIGISGRLVARACSPAGLGSNRQRRQGIVGFLSGLDIRGPTRRRLSNFIRTHAAHLEIRAGLMIRFGDDRCGMPKRCFFEPLNRSLIRWTDGASVISRGREGPRKRPGRAAGRGKLAAAHST